MELAVRGLVWRHGQVLLVRMNYGPLKGRWVLPGGLVKDGETILEAAIREVREESAVDMAPTAILALRHFVAEQRNNLLAIIAGEHLGGEPAPDGREVNEARFFYPQQALDLDNLYPVGRLAITLMIQRATGLRVFPGSNPHFQFMLPSNVDVPSTLVPSQP